MTISQHQAPASTVRDIPLEQLVVSETRSQNERRRHLNQAAIDELAESIRTVGVLQPIVARPIMCWALPCGHAVVDKEREKWSTSSGQPLRSPRIPPDSLTGKDPSISPETVSASVSRKAKGTTASNFAVGSKKSGASGESLAKQKESLETNGLAGVGQSPPGEKSTTCYPPRCPICASGALPLRKRSRTLPPISTVDDVNGLQAKIVSCENNTGIAQTGESGHGSVGPQLRSAIDAENSGSILIDASGQPLNGRNARYEVVAGERRLLAAERAGLDQIQALVRDLTDQQVIEIQLVENLQRQDLHELAEAEGYEALMQQHSYTVEDLVAKVGKSRGTVYARLKLLALCKKARTAFYDGKLTASTALLIARIPVPELQEQALREIIERRWGDGPMSTRDAAGHIHKHYMLRLDQAGFQTSDPDLVPAAGACGPCPKRTGNQAELFHDVGRADVCTDPICFRAKRDAHKARRIVEAAANGQQVITGKAAKKIAPYGTNQWNLQGGWVRLDARCSDDVKLRSYQKILGKTAPAPALLEDPDHGELVELVQLKEIKPLLKEKGIGGPRPRDNSPYAQQQRAQKRKAKCDGEYRRRLFIAVSERAPATLGRAELELVAVRLFKRTDNDTQKKLFGVWDWNPAKDDKKWRGAFGQVDYDKIAAARIPELDDAGLARLLLDLVYGSALPTYTWGGKPERLLARAKALGIDADAIRKAVDAEDKAKAQRKKATTKKKVAKKAPAKKRKVA